MSENLVSSPPYIELSDPASFSILDLLERRVVSVEQEPIARVEREPDLTKQLLEQLASGKASLTDLPIGHTFHPHDINRLFLRHLPDLPDTRSFFERVDVWGGGAWENRWRTCGRFILRYTAVRHAGPDRAQLPGMELAVGHHVQVFSLESTEAAHEFLHKVKFALSEVVTGVENADSICYDASAIN